MAPSGVSLHISALILGYLLIILSHDMIRASAMKTTAGNAFRLAGLSGGHGIIAGQTISPKPDAGAGDKNKPREAWALKTGLYTPRQLVEGFAPLLDTVVFRLGQDPPNARPSRAQLLDNLANNLNTNTREASLRFPDNGLDDSRSEIAEQARRIGKTLVQYARSHEGGPFDPDLYLRSPCEGHLLIPPNVDLMFGRRSQSHLMQLFNEYMHQMVLLRDALLPFQNYEDVIIPINGQAARGIRHMEPPREEFLTQIMTKEVSQAAVIKQAQALLAPGLISRGFLKTGPALGYGFQYAHGVVLPAVLAGGETPLHLLRYLPTRLVQDTVKDVVFDYRISDYYEAPRIQVPAGIETAIHATNGLKTQALQATSATINVAQPEASTSSARATRHLELQVELDNGKCVAVDLGQIARGHRYAYQPHKSPADSELNGEADVTGRLDSSSARAVVHDAASILLEGSQEGLITAKEGGFHVIPAEDSLVRLALLGRLYPENVVLLPQLGILVQAAKAGKGLEPKFVIWGGERGPGLRGYF